MEGSIECFDTLICSGARRLTGYQRRLFMAEVTTELCKGSARQAERRFGWGRETVLKGLHESRQGIRCLENFAARGRLRSEEKDPQLAADIRAIVEPHTYADPQLKSSRRYTNLSAAEVREALIAAGHPSEKLPSERTLRDILNRMNYRLKRIQKGKPLKKTKETDAIFANVKEVQQQARSDPETLEISMDTKAKVGVIPKCGHAALRLDCFLVDVCVTSSSSSSSSFNPARHSGGVQRQSVRRSLAIASRVCSTISSQRPDTTAARSWNTASALSSVQ